VGATTPTLAQQPKSGGTVIVGLAGNPPGLNPDVAFSSLTGFVSGQVYNALVSYDYDLNLIPELAKSWVVSPDGLTITFELEQGVLFHDGTPFTSADVKYSIEEVSRKHHPVGLKAFGVLDRIDTPTPHTAVFRLKQPFPAMLAFLSAWYAAILPKHLYDGTDPLKNPANTQPIGTGPFRLKEFVSGSHITLERNPAYWRKGRPYLDRVVFKIVPDETARVIAFERGELDVLNYYGFPFSEAERLAKLPNVKVSYDPVAFAPVMMAMVNLRGPVLGKREVRQAMAHAINKEEILQRAMFGAGKVAISPIPTDIAWAHNAKVKRYSYDLNEANRLLDKAGLPRGADGTRFKVNIFLDGNRLAHRKAAEIMRDDLRKAGIDLEIKATELGSMMETVFKTWNFDLALSEITHGPDPVIGTARLYTSEQILRIPFTNSMGYSNAQVDRLFAEAGRTVDRKKQAELYRRIQEILVEDLPALWLIEATNPTMFRTDFVGFPTGPFKNERMDGVWWGKGK
jgi:peptide/nickel transport system substrate-binding protein